jgi:hypothetical protein
MVVPPGMVRAPGEKAAWLHEGSVVVTESEGVGEPAAAHAAPPPVAAQLHGTPAAGPSPLASEVRAAASAAPWDEVAVPGEAHINRAPDEITGTPARTIMVTASRIPTPATAEPIVLAR